MADKKSKLQFKNVIRAWAAGNEFMRFGGEAVEGVYLFDYYVDKKIQRILRIPQKIHGKIQGRAFVDER